MNVIEEVEATFLHRIELRFQSIPQQLQMHCERNYLLADLRNSVNAFEFRRNEHRPHLSDLLFLNDVGLI